MFKIRRLISKANISNIYESVLVKNDCHLLYLLYQLSNYHPEKVPYVDLVCLIAIKKRNQSMNMIKKYFSE